MLPSNQQQIIGQARFTYSPLGKAFEKQIKTIEGQGKKTSWCFRKFEDKNNYIQIKDIYDEILEKITDEILEMSRGINYSNIVYDFIGSTPSINFSIFRGWMYTYNQLKIDEKTLQQMEEEQKYF